MANQELIAGVDSFTLFGVESTYGTKASTINKHLGLVTSFNAKHNKNVKEHKGFVGADGGGQETVKFTTGIYEGDVTAKFTPLEWSWMEYVLGSASGSGTNADPYLYTRANNPSGLSFVHEKNNDTTDSSGEFLGCRFESVTINGATGDEVNVSAELKALKFTKDTTLESNANLPSGEVFHFAGTTVELPDGSTLSHIFESAEIQIVRNAKRKYGFGNYVAQNMKYGAINYKFNLGVTYLDDTFLDDFLGSSTSADNAVTENATLTIVFTQTSGSRWVEFRFSGVVFPSIDETADLNEFITEGVPGIAKSLIVAESQSS